MLRRILTVSMAVLNGETVLGTLGVSIPVAVAVSGSAQCLLCKILLAVIMLGLSTVGPLSIRFEPTMVSSVGDTVRDMFGFCNIEPPQAGKEKDKKGRGR